MYNGNTVGVVVKAYNEEGFVGRVIDTLPAFVDRAYVVDDHSTDGTWMEIQRHARHANETRLSDGSTSRFVPPVMPIRHERNRGVGGAMKTGYKRALEDGLDVVATLDGDGQMNPSRLTRLLDPVVDGRVDYAKGDRLSTNGHHGTMTPWRRFGNGLLTRLTRISTGYRNLSDSQNGYTVISRHALETIDIDDLYEDYGVLNDILARLNAAGFKVADVCMPAEYGDEKSGIRYGSFVPKLSTLLLRNFFVRLQVRYLDRPYHPIALSYVLGTLGVSIGLARTLRSIVGNASGKGGGRTISDGGSDSYGRTENRALYEAAATLVVGGVCILLGTFADLRSSASVDRIALGESNSGDSVSASADASTHSVESDASSETESEPGSDADPHDTAVTDRWADAVERSLD